MPKTTRLRALQALLRKKNVPALLATDPLNVRYLSGLKATEALLLVRAGSSTLVVDGRYIEVARRRSENTHGVAAPGGTSEAVGARPTLRLRRAPRDGGAPGALEDDV